jgi:hypothetical protein
MARLTEDEPEDVVENEPLASGVWAQVESLGVWKGVLPVINLEPAVSAATQLAEPLECPGQYTHHELTSHQDDNAAGGGGLGIDGAVNVLDLLEREALQDDSAKPGSPRALSAAAGLSYHKLLNDVAGTKLLSALKREHRVVPLFPGVSQISPALATQPPTKLCSRMGVHT